MNARGQVSLELMLLVMVMLLYLQTTTLPLVAASAKAMQEVNGVGKARLAFDQVHEAVESLAYSTGDGRRSLEVFVPAGAKLSCEGRAFSFAVSLDASLDQVKACSGDNDGNDYLCTHSRPWPLRQPVECRTAAWQGPGWKTVVVERAKGGLVLE